MSAEFNPITGRTDIISHMAEAGEGQKPKRTPKREGIESSGKLSSKQRYERFLETRDNLRPVGHLESGGFPVNKKTKERMGITAKEAQEIAEKAEPADVVFTTKISLHGDIDFPVTVERRQDGSLVMNDLPPSKYDKELIARIIQGVGVSGEADFPENWDSRSKEAKKAFLKVKYGIDSLDAPLNINPQLVNTYRDGRTVPLSFRELLLEKWANVGLVGPPTQRAYDIDAEIADRINSQDPYLILTADRDLKEIANSIEDDPQSQQELDQVLPVALRQQLEAAKAVLDLRFNSILNRMSDISRSATIGDIEDTGASELQSVRQGWHGVNQAVEQVIGVADSKKEVPSQEGLRMWYAFQKIEQISEGYDIYKRTQVSPDPLENIRNVEIVMRLFEQSKTPENFAEARQSLNGLLHAIELSAHPDIPQSRKDELRKRLDAFELVNTFLIKIDQTEGDPEQLLNVARNFTDETWFYFYDRFNAEELRDVNNKKYLIKTENGVEQTLNINILSETQNAFAYQYMVDRFRTNQVQSWLRNGLNIDQALDADANGSTYNDERWFIEKIVNLPQGVTFGDLRQNVALRSRLQDELNRRWQEESTRKGLVRKWYEEETFVGADLYDPASGRRRIDVWQDRIMATVLRQRLERAGVDAGRIDDLEADEELIGALKRNGYDLAKYTYADSIDKLEYFDSKGEHTETIFGEETPYSARVVTSFMDFALSEAQGDERVNKVVRKQLTYQWADTREEDRPISEGWLLPQNMTAFRILMQGEGKLLESSPLKGDIEAATRREQQRKMREMGVSDVPERDVLGYVVAKKLFEGIDPDEVTINDEFANINWGEVSRDMKRFDIGDMLEDRFKSQKWFMGEFRNWLNHPTDTEFVEMTQKYYSMRNVRKHPGTADYLEMQWEAGQHWEDWFDYDRNISSATMEGFIQQARELNLIDKERAEFVKHKLLGREPVQSIRQLGEMFAEMSRATVGSRGWWAGGFWDFLKSWFKYLASGK